jgi:hypothetical protein
MAGWLSGGLGVSGYLNGGAPGQNLRDGHNNLSEIVH